MRNLTLGRLAAAALFGSVALAGVASAQAPPPKEKGIESEGYQWNKMEGEKVEALTLKGDAKRGEDAYEVCAACHLSSGSGRPDGTFPQLAGQHHTVLIKQIADVAVYLETLPIPPNNGRGPGGEHLKRGEQLYKQDCVKCHGPSGEGSMKDFYPVLAGQHYEYLLRQIKDIAGGKRRNANPDMVKVVKTYPEADLQAVVDYMSRLSWPERTGKKG